MKIIKSYKPYSIHVFALLLALFWAGCAADRKIERKVSRLIKGSSILNNHPVGFALSDLENGKVIYEKDADKYFIPASNTKLFTFYGGLKMLPDSIPSLRYIERGDSLIFWGTGDPSFLQSRLKGVNALNFLRTSGKQLFFSAGRYSGNFYGMGWSWDDYNDYYQAEITELPLMDNLIAVTSENGRLRVSPAKFKHSLMKDSLNTAKTFSLTRDFTENRLRHPDIGTMPKGYEQQIPYKTSTQLTLSLLTDTLHRPVGLVLMGMPSTAKTIYNVPSEQVLREMMLPSDNFIAEQLLLVYSNQFQPLLSGSDAIQYIREKYLAGLPDKPRWVDGSGLSRMDLFTPRDIVALLKMIDQQVNNREKLFSMLPAGGKTGTLKNAYPKTDQPFVYGKTGSLSNVYNQSGYLLTKKGRTLSFSFMNNNFVSPVADLKKEMARVITYIHEKF
ncbi:D-alanyl-D-alanine carboxypeptidase/D-alanyl-D-alanine-endopeptidase [Pedobacter hartonius]|uniref:D-alanyl-D-alanine carboxypeptidase / D-alanyl-D-alanine-endopeptidase (Penicillin-binding protein 4) n=1 Tax=Pedobacter hartonius TaxID=425514 RepID=A0A1H4FBK2_9SPHI|nr:D-alanyl-D-alanine carboxypeptidase [Pedobacter hartonius]SEA94387.1 D-alanyl-D-alanine carboxypeptidase / D-alanyl-D-alanine-endopeptidase (penicillin-binding protein 4) [Pedobacter hartonius]